MDYESQCDNSILDNLGSLIEARDQSVNVTAAIDPRVSRTFEEIKLPKGPTHKEKVLNHMRASFAASMNKIAPRIS